MAYKIETTLDHPRLLNLIESTKHKHFEDDTERKEMLKALHEAAEKIETPLEKTLRLTWYLPPLYAAIKIALDLNLFGKWKDSSLQVMSLEQLSQLTSVEPSLLSPIVNHLASMKVIEESGADGYLQTPFTTALTRPEMSANFRWLFDVHFCALINLPAHLARTDYQYPRDANMPPFNTGLQYTGPFFGFLSQYPHHAHTFNEIMSSYTTDMKTWTDFYPARERLLQGPLHPEEKVLVDVGGGLGQDIAKFRHRFPETSGKLVLQDLKETVEKAQEMAGVEKTVHDFFTPQPVQAPRAFYLHSILHDWPDDSARSILRNLRPACAPHTKLLINENVIAARNPDPHVTSVDMTMMTLFASGERDDASWKRLVESEGFRVEKIWSSVIAPESLIECVPVEQSH